MKTTKTCFITIYLFLSTFLFAQTEWKSFTNKGIVTCTTFNGENVWAGTTGGLVKLNISGDLVAEYERDDGIAGINITCSAVDLDGRLWVGTYGGGISVFDGNVWKTYNLHNSGLGSNDITSIRIDNEGNKWITTYGGAYLYNNATWKQLDGFPTGTVYSVDIDKDNNKWFATYNGAVKYKNGVLQIYNTQNSGLLADIIRDVAIDSKGQKWFVGAREIAVYNDTVWSSWKLFEEGDFGENTNDISCLTIDKSNKCYIGTVKGVFLFDGDSLKTSYNTSNSNILSNHINSIEIDTSGNIWCGVYGGISVFNGKDWKNIYPSTTALISNYISSIAIDACGRKWFGTEFGAAFYDDKNWTTFNGSNSGLKTWMVSAIAYDKKGNMWFGGNEGIFVFNGSSWIKHDITNVRSIVIGPSDSVWAATWNGLFLFDGVSWTMFNTSNSKLPSNEVQSLALDRKGNLWIATNGGGAAKLHGSDWILYNQSNSGLKSNRVRAIAVDMNDNVWFATDLGTNSVAMFDGNMWKSYYSTYFVSSIAVDKYNYKWFGTAINGVLFFDNKNWKAYNILNSGINSDHIRTIAVDGAQNVWIGTAYEGVSRFNYSALNVLTQDLEIPDRIIVSQNYPNPFNPSTTIRFSIPTSPVPSPYPLRPRSEASQGEGLRERLVTLKVYDLLGREIATLVNEEKAPGNYEVKFDAETRRGESLPSGVYFYKLQAGIFVQTKKMVLLK